MVIKYIKLNFFVLIGITILISGCVGKIEDKNPNDSKSAISPPATITFGGIQKVTPISNNKVEVKFFSAPGLANELIYDVSFDGLSTPITIPGELMQPDFEGMLKYTVTGLDTSSKYSFSVEVHNKKDPRIKSNSKNSISSTTFSIQTADFSGVSAVYNNPGNAGTNSINVQWNVAASSGFAIDSDPNYYEIRALDADLGRSPVDFDNSTYDELSGRFVTIVSAGKTNSIRSYNIQGLTPGHKYYVNVRAIDNGTVKNPTNPIYIPEQNSSYLTIKTFSTTSSGITPDSSKTSYALLPGNLGLFGATITWAPFLGNFYEYRIYIKNEAITTSMAQPVVGASCSTLVDPTLKCVTVSSDLSSKDIPLFPYNLNNQNSVHIVVCTDLPCSTYQFFQPISIIANPSTPNFGGIISMTKSMEPSSPNQITLNFNPPDLSSGALRDYAVALTTVPNNLAHRLVAPVQFWQIYPEPLLPPSTPYELTVIPFNYQTAKSITIKGVNPSENVGQYCFVIAPLPIDQSILPDFAGQIPYCVSPNPDATNVNDTSRLIELSTSVTNLTISKNINTVLVTWAPPFGITDLLTNITFNGMFDKYVLFYRQIPKASATTFNFNDALDSNSPNFNTYNRVNISSSSVLAGNLPEYIIPIIGDGSLDVIQVGVLTQYSLYNVYYNSMSDPSSSYSETTIKSAPVAQCINTDPSNFININQLTIDLGASSCQ